MLAGAQLAHVADQAGDDLAGLRAGETVDVDILARRARHALNRLNLLGRRRRSTAARAGVRPLAAAPLPASSRPAGARRALSAAATSSSRSASSSSAVTPTFTA